MSSSVAGGVRAIVSNKRQSDSRDIGEEECLIIRCQFGCPSTNEDVGSVGAIERGYFFGHLPEPVSELKRKHAAVVERDCEGVLASRIWLSDLYGMLDEEGWSIRAGSGIDASDTPVLDGRIAASEAHEIALTSNDLSVFVHHGVLVGKAGVAAWQDESVPEHGGGAEDAVAVFTPGEDTLVQGVIAPRLWSERRKGGGCRGAG